MVATNYLLSCLVNPSIIVVGLQVLYSQTTAFKCTCTFTHSLELLVLPSWMKLSSSIGIACALHMMIFIIKSVRLYLGHHPQRELHNATFVTPIRSFCPFPYLKCIQERGSFPLLAKTRTVTSWLRSCLLFRACFVLPSPECAISLRNVLFHSEQPFVSHACTIVHGHTCRYAECNAALHRGWACGLFGRGVQDHSFARS
jgi:hypothetical protein